MDVGRKALHGGARVVFVCGDKVHIPGGVTGVLWDTSSAGTPARLEVELFDRGDFPIGEGDRVVFFVGGERVFCGYIFSRERSSSCRVRIVCYDQLRYLKNRDSYVFEYKTASEILKIIADDHGLLLGDVEGTGYRIPSLVESSAAMIDIIGSALDITRNYTGREFVLMDNRGRIELCSSEKTAVGCVLTESSAERFTLASSIDSGVYNKVMVCGSRENGRQFTAASDGQLIKKWGELQLLSKSGDAAVLLSSHSSPARSLEVENAEGDARVRGGTAVGIDVDFGVAAVRRFVRVERARHRFRGGEHVMSLVCSVEGSNF